MQEKNTKANSAYYRRTKNTVLICSIFGFVLMLAIAAIAIFEPFGALVHHSVYDDNVVPAWWVQDADVQWNRDELYKLSILSPRQRAELQSHVYAAASAYKINDVISNTSRIADLSDQRMIVYNTAMSIINEVPYFWGGKTKIAAKDPQWGQQVLVESKGSETTGTYQPYGLDCSGYVSWCFLHTGIDWDAMCELVGNGTLNQWNKSVSIDWDELQVGDLVFESKYPEAKGNHVGICIGFDSYGVPYFAHSASSLGGVVISPAGDIFVYARRPLFYGD